MYTAIMYIISCSTYMCVHIVLHLVYDHIMVSVGESVCIYVNVKQEAYWYPWNWKKQYHDKMPYSVGGTVTPSIFKVCIHVFFFSGVYSLIHSYQSIPQNPKTSWTLGSLSRYSQGFSTIPGGFLAGFHVSPRGSACDSK